MPLMRCALFARPIRLERNGRATTSATLEQLEKRTLLSASWENVQIGGGGYVTGLAASSDGVVYMRTDVGGAYRWDAAASSWRAITDSLPPDVNNGGALYGINAIAVDPANANRVFIAAGKYDWSNPSGIYVSTNTNTANPTWSAVDSTVRAYANGSPVRQNGERLLVDPNNSNVIYYGTINVTNGGTGLRKYYYDTAWHGSTLATPAIGDSKYGITFVAADKNGGTVSDGSRTVSKYLYMGAFSNTAGAGGIFASSNGGASWTEVTGLTLDKPYRGEVGVDGTLYVTYDGGVAKVARGATTFTSITPPGGNLDFCSLAVDPVVAGTVMVSDFTFSGTGTYWRSLNGGSTWVVMKRNINAKEPDGTPSVTGNGSADHVSDLLINPANLDEVWASDFLGVARTQNIKDDAVAASDWYSLQRGHEEVVVLDLKSAPTGLPLASAVADVNGFMHADPAVRPPTVNHFDSPSYLSTTSVDFSEGTSGASTVWARVGQRFYGSEQNGGFSLDDGINWGEFGELERKTILNATTAGWESFDVGPYLKAQKAAGLNTVTLVVRSSAWQTNQSFLKFSSKQGANAPRIMVNGSTPLTVTADATVNAASPGTNYGSSTELVARNYYDQDWYNNWVYLKFDLTSVASISSASLQLYRLAGNGAYSFTTTVQATPTTGWSETTINWTNRPVDLYAPPTDYYERGGRIAVSATDPANMVWFTEAGHVWYTKDRGIRWTQGTVNGYAIWGMGVTEFQQDKVALASDRVLTDTFFLYNKRTTEIYRSTNGGATWSIIASNVGAYESYKLETLPGVGGRFWFILQEWNMARSLRYWNGTSLVNVGGIPDVVDFAFGKALPGKTNPVAFARKADGSYWYSTDATAGSTFTWTKMNVPAIGDGPHVMEGDRQTIGRLYVGTDGRGAFFVDAGIPYDATAPTLTSFAIGEGSSQRSMIRQIDLAFSEDVTVSSAAAKLLTRRGGVVAGVTASVTTLGARSARVIFSGPAIIGGSLPDGVYALQILATGVHDTVDNAMAANANFSFHRLFGDADGDRDVDSVDLRRFNSSLSRPSNYLWYFDFDNSKTVNALDLAEIKKRMARRPL